MYRRQQPQAALTLLLLLLISLCALLVTAVPSTQDGRLNRLQNNWLKDLEVASEDEADLEEVPEDGSEVLLSRTKRRIELPDLEVDGSDDDPYTIIEESDDCFWCESSTPEDDDEHRAAVITTYHVFVTPGTCVVNKSPSWPGLYPNNVDQRYTYTTASGSMLTFSVPVGGLQISRGCYRDKLNVRVGRTTVKKCGQFYNFVITSRSLNIMYIRFASNDRIRWHGYKGTVCSSVAPTSKTTPVPETTTTPPESTTTTTPTPPVYCDDICGNLAGYTAPVSGRISQGTQATTSYPWVIIVDVMRDHVFVRCSGYLISRHHIITSAYCFFQETPQGINNTMVRVTAGEYDISSNYETPAVQVLYTSNVTLYPSYNSSYGGGVYNMALLTMPGEGFSLNTLVAPICLANSTVKTALAGKNAILSLTGFGWTKNAYPAVNLTTATIKTCPFIFPDTDLICIYLVGAASTPCQGDAGAAIYKKWNTDNRYYAIAHVNAVTIDTCPLSGFVFPCPVTAYYINWINNVTGPRLCNMD